MILTLNIAGPDSTMATIQDSVEPYEWRLDTYQQRLVGDFAEAYANLTDDQKAATTLTLDDGDLGGSGGEVTVTIGADNSSNNVGKLGWTFTGDDRPLLASAGASGLFTNGVANYLARLEFHSGNADSIFRVTPDSTETEFGTGDDLNYAWERYEGPAFIISAGGHTLEIEGPNSANNENTGTTDDSEPYNWRPSATQKQAISAFRTAYDALSQAEKDATTLTLRDGQTYDWPIRPTGPLEITLGHIGWSQAFSTYYFRNQTYKFLGYAASSSLFADPTVPYFFRNLSFSFLNGTSYQQSRLEFGNSSQSTSSSSENFNGTWESYDPAYTISAGGLSFGIIWSNSYW